MGQPRPTALCMTQDVFHASNSALGTEFILPPAVGLILSHEKYSSVFET